MPLASPIGSNQGLKTRAALEIIIEQANIPVVVDAGLGLPSHAADAMEMGADAVLVNTAIATADDPPTMAEAFRLAVEAGIEGVTLYQETYDRRAYRHYHPSGPKSDYDNKLNAPDRIAAAGMREIGLGVLLSLTNWRGETLALAEHAHYLIKRYWQSHVSFSFPRLRPAHEVPGSQFEHLLSDKNLVQMITALRLCFADAGMTLSTRERAQLRDNLIKLGITKLSAGSRTNPGGYSGRSGAIEQFEVDDNRSPAQVAAMIRQQGFEPVWKDWDSSFVKE